MNKRLVHIVITLSVALGFMGGWMQKSVPRLFHGMECSRSLHLHRKASLSQLRNAERGNIEGITSEHIRTRAVRDMIIMEYIMVRCADVPELTIRMLRAQARLRPYVSYQSKSTEPPETHEKFQDVSSPHPHNSCGWVLLLKGSTLV